VKGSVGVCPVIAVVRELVSGMSSSTVNEDILMIYMYRSGEIIMILKNLERGSCTESQLLSLGMQRVFIST
jgi:hypothetical protein